MKHKTLVYLLLLTLTNLSFLQAHNNLDIIPPIPVPIPEYVKASVKIAHAFVTQNNLQDAVSEGFDTCHTAIENNEDSLLLPDLLEALPDIITILQKADTGRAVRPQAGNKIVGPTNTCELGTLTPLLLNLQDQLMRCCETLQSDFAATWTILADIKDTIITEFQATFTALTDIEDTLTTCCAELTDTITTQFQATFTALADIKDSLTECCAALTETTTTNFQSTFTILSFVTACLSMPIETPTTITIPGTYCLAQDITGTIVINSDNVTLNLNDHTINNGAIIVNAGSNRLIENGAINNAANGIICNSNTNTTIRNVSVTNGFTNGILFNNPTTDCSVDNVVCENCGNGINCNGVAGGIGLHITHFVINNSSGSGITIANTTKIVIHKGNIENSTNEGITINNCADIQCSDVTIETSGGIGIHLIGPNNSALMKNIIVARSPQGIIATGNLSESLFEQCKILDCTTNVTANITPVCGIGIHNGTNVQLDSCLVKNYSATGASAFIAGFRCSGNSFILRNCTAQTLSGSSSSTVHGFSFPLALSNAVVSDCVSTNISGGGLVAGFFMEGDSISITRSIVRSVTTIGGGTATGFNNTGNESTITWSQAYNCANEGFNIAAPASLIEYCQSSYNNTGFLIQSSGITVGNCVATQNTAGTGFNTTVANVPVYWCFATDNGTNYGGTVINVNNASDQVNPAILAPNGPFAGTNIFIP